MSYKAKKPLEIAIDSLITSIANYKKLEIDEDNIETVLNELQKLALNIRLICENRGRY